MSTDDEKDDADVEKANEKLRRLTAEPPTTPEKEFEMCRAVIASVRAALAEAEEELRQAKRAWKAKVHSLEQEMRMIEIANQRLRERLQKK